MVRYDDNGNSMWLSEEYLSEALKKCDDVYFFYCLSIFYSSHFPLGSSLKVLLFLDAVLSFILQEAPAGDEDDDDLDLFGDETEEEKKAAEEREAAAKKAFGKKKESKLLF